MFDAERSLVTVELCLRFELGQRGSPEASGVGHTICEIEGVYRADYQLVATPTMSQESLEAFAEINGQLTITPYWREFVSAALSRSGLPPLMIPVFNPLSAIRARAARRAEEKAKQTQVDNPPEKPAP